MRKELTQSSKFYVHRDCFIRQIIILLILIDTATPGIIDFQELPYIEGLI